MSTKLRLLLLAGLLTAAYGMLVVVDPEATMSPGDVLAGHAEIASDCLACHAPLRGTPAARCASCHEPERIGLETTAGVPIVRNRDRPAFHARLAEPRCAACHTEHRGAEPAESLTAFSHVLLENTTLERCGTCHAEATPDDALHANATEQCGECHTTDAFRPATFDHDELFRFDRHHPDDDCRACHPQGLDRYTCYGCHAHSERSVAREHREEGIRDFADCVSCHRSGDEHEAERRYRDTVRSQRATSAGPSNAEHAEHAEQDEGDEDDESDERDD